MGLTGFQSRKGQAAVLNCQQQDDPTYYDGHHRQSNFHNGQTYNGKHR